MQFQPHHLTDERLLPLEEDARVVRPHWANPGMEEGMGLELRLDCTVADLIGRYHDRIITIAHAAGFLLINCRAGDPPGVTPTALATNRDKSDMIPHTDRVHRDHLATTLVAGVSSVPTLIVAKPVLARAWSRSVQSWQQEALFRYACFANNHVVHSEADGVTPVFCDETSEVLSGLYCDALCHNNVRAMERQLFSMIDGVHADMQDIVTWGTVQERGREQVAAITRLVYHSKGVDAGHEYGRDGNKRRFTLVPSDQLHLELKEAFGKVTHTDRVPISLDWIRGQEME